jgi:hypothetical protein
MPTNPTVITVPPVSELPRSGYGCRSDEVNWTSVYYGFVIGALATILIGLLVKVYGDSKR